MSEGEHTVLIAEALKQVITHRYLVKRSLDCASL